MLRLVASALTAAATSGGILIPIIFRFWRGGLILVMPHDVDMSTSSQVAIY